MKLELQDAKGLTGVFIELPLDQLRAEIGLVSSSGETEALLKEHQGNVALLQESQRKVAELEEKLARAEAKTMDEFTPIEKANFVIGWAKELSPEDKAIFAGAVEIPIAQATVAEVAEAEGEPKIIQGKTDRPGYRFLEHLGLSIKED